MNNNRSYALIFFPKGKNMFTFFPAEIKAEIKVWAADFDVKIEEKLIHNDTMHIKYDCITFVNAEDELAFRLKYWVWISEKL
jgi:hypothetical protein